MGTHQLPSKSNEYRDPKVETPKRIHPGCLEFSLLLTCHLSKTEGATTFVWPSHSIDEGGKAPLFKVWLRVWLFQEGFFVKGVSPSTSCFVFFLKVVSLYNYSCHVLSRNLLVLWQESRPP